VRRLINPKDQWEGTAMPQQLLDSADTGDITLSRPAVYRQPRRANPMAWWWASAVIFTTAFATCAVMTAQYAALTDPDQLADNPAWHVMRSVTGILSVAAVACWAAAALAKLILRGFRSVNNRLAALDQQITERANGTQLAEEAKAAAGRIGMRVLREQ